MTNLPENPNKDIIYRRKNGLMPYVIRKEGKLYLEFGAGSDSNHDPRTFRVPILDIHLKVIEADFLRHLLLWSALMPLADAAGTSGPLDEHAAVALLNPILLGTEAEVEALLQQIKFYEATLISHHADISLLKQGKIFAASESLSIEADPKLALEHAANQRRAQRGIYLSILDKAVLKYTNQYLYGGGLPSRNPGAVDPELLPQVLEIIATAEQACAGMEFPWDYDTDDSRYHQRDKKEWNLIKSKVEQAMHSTYPDLSTDTVETVSFLMCREAATRAHIRQKKA